MDPVTGAIVSSGIQSGSDVGSAFLGNYFNRKASKRQYKYWRWSVLEGPSLQVAGLRKAGLNPILAAGGSSASSMSPGLSAQNVHASNMANTMSSAATLSLARKQAQLLDAQTDKEKNQSNMYANLASAAGWDALNKSFDTYKNELTTKVYEGKIGQKILPILRAMSESGVGISDVIRAGSATFSSAGSILQLIRNSRKIGF